MEISQRILHIHKIQASGLTPQMKISALEAFVEQEKKADEQEKKDQEKAIKQERDEELAEKKMTNTQKVEITNPLKLDGIEVLTLKGDKGDKPSDEELLSLIKPLIPEPVKGDKGDSVIGPKGKIGPRGLKGDKGESIVGPPGKDAIVKNETVIEELLKQINKQPKQKIHIKNLDGISELQDKIVNHAVTQARGLLYAGLFDNKIKAGSNITVTANADGSVVIASTSSGGGFTKLLSTETPDGSNTVFTYSQKPLYIISGGAWYEENNGWTWNAGTLQATLSTPPPVQSLQLLAFV